MRHAILPLFLCLLLTACSAPTRTYTFRALELSNDADHTASPIPRARVRAVPLAIGPVPLPVKDENLQQAAIEKGDAGATDDEGRVRLRLARDYTYEIQVVPSPFHHLGGRGVKRWRFDTASLALTPERAAPERSDGPPWIGLVLDE